MNRDELRAPAPPEGPVEAVVGGVGRNRVLDVRRAAEPLERVVTVHVNLDVLIRATAAHALERYTVQLIVRAELHASELDAHVAQRTAVVIGIVSAINTGVGLADAFAPFDIHRSTAVDDEAAPVAAGAAANGLVKIGRA